MAKKMADLQNTVRHLKIILFSLFFLLIIRASIWRPYDKKLAKPCYCQTPLTLRFHLVFWCLSSNRHFGTLTLKFLLNRITKETITNLQNTVKRFGVVVFRKCFAAHHQSDILELFLWNPRRTPMWKKYGQFAKHCHRNFIHRFPLVCLFVSCKQRFGVFTERFLLNQITSHKMACLKNIFTRLRIIVLYYSYGAYHQNDTLKHLPWNCHLTPLWRKRWSICEILSHASKSSFSFSYLVLIVWATLCSC